MNRYSTFIVILFFASVFVGMAGCNGSSDRANGNRSSESVKNKPVDAPQSEPDSGWPKETQKLVDHLNDWDANELIAYNEPERFPNFKTSGETNGWISSHQEQLSNLGVEISWDKQMQKYVIAKPAP